MSTSERSRLFPVAAGVAIMAAATSWIAAPDDPLMRATPVHPAWLIAAVVVAVHGVRALVAIPAVIVGVQLAALLCGAPELEALFAGEVELGMIERISEPGEVFALSSLLVLACAGTIQQARRTRLQEQLRTTTTRATTAEDAVEQLTELSVALRERCDRSEVSLSFVADLAIRMDDPDPATAGDAALALAIARTGARGGYVQLLDGERLRCVCSRGTWSATHVTPPAVFRDLVALAAVERAGTVAAHEVPDASTDDSDLAAPIIGTSGATIGVVALRGIAAMSLTLVIREDLSAVARWAGHALSRHRNSPGAAFRTAK